MKYPNFSFEKNLWRHGYKIVAGVDEVGRGSFAGPIVAGCVVFSKQFSIFHLPFSICIDDSKKLKPRQREKAAKWIKENVLTYGLGSASVAEINKRGMAKASKTAFRRAVYSANNRRGKKIEYLLIDAFYIPYVNGVRMPLKRKRIKTKERKSKNILLDKNSKQTAIIHGDEKSFSIAAASIIAKVHRDKLMRDLSKKPKYKIYGWGRNKGYGTEEHRLAIKEYGTSRFHRKKYIETYLSKLAI